MGPQTGHAWVASRMVAGSPPLLETGGTGMAEQFNGKIALDVRDSVPDWKPYLLPTAPENARTSS